MPPIACIALGYLLGSIPFGLLLTRAAGLGDIRKVGSGNIGATNVLRTGNKKLAAATLLLDGLKGAAAVLIARATLADDMGQDGALWAGLGAVIGHMFPVWLGFKGGKGVATFIGVLLGLFPLGVLVFAAVWLGLAFLLRYSSASALAASAATPLALWAFGQGRLAVLFCVLALLLWWKHAPNIRRLAAGTEGRIGQKG